MKFLKSIIWLMKMNYKMIKCSLRFGKSSCRIVGMVGDKLIASGYSVTRIVR